MKKLLLISTFIVLLFSRANSQCTAGFSYQLFSTQLPAYVYFTDSSLGSIVTWTWDFGDGTAPVTTQNPSHTYVAPGNYLACLMISDGISCFDTLCQMISIPVPPPVDIQYFNDSAGSYFCTFPDSVQFDFYGYTYGYLQTDSAKIELQFGDGTDTTYYYLLTNSFFSGYISHTYSGPGTYNAALKVIGPDGSFDTAFAQPVVINSTCGNISGTVYQDLNGNCI